jgi:oleate hydratase
MYAVCTLLGVDRPIPPIYHGILDPRTGLKALETALSAGTAAA